MKTATFKIDKPYTSDMEKTEKGLTLLANQKYKLSGLGGRVKENKTLNR